MDLSTYQQLKKKVDDMQRDADRAAGELSQIIKQVKEAGCGDLKDVEKQLKKLHAEQTADEKELQKEMDALEKEHGQRLL